MRYQAIVMGRLRLEHNASYLLLYNPIVSLLIECTKKLSQYKLLETESVEIQCQAMDIEARTKNCICNSSIITPMNMQVI